MIYGIKNGLTPVSNSGVEENGSASSVTSSGKFFSTDISEFFWKKYCKGKIAKRLENTGSSMSLSLNH